jgi:hypothetical protein
MQKCNSMFFVLWATQKMTKSDKNKDLKICILTSTHFSLFFSSKYKLFEIDILHVCGIHHRPYPGFFSICCKNKYFFFQNRQDHSCLEAKNLHSIKKKYNLHEVTPTFYRLLNMSTYMFVIKCWNKLSVFTCTKFLLNLIS